MDREDVCPLVKKTFLPLVCRLKIFYFLEEKFMKPVKTCFALWSVLLWALTFAQGAVRIQNSAGERPVAVGETVTFTISGLESMPEQISGRRVENMHEIEELKLDREGKGEIVWKTQAKAPGVLALAIDTGKGYDRSYRKCARSALLVAPESVKAATTPADDIIAYWEGLKAAMKDVSSEPHLKLVYDGNPATAGQQPIAKDPYVKLAQLPDDIEIYSFEIDAGGGSIDSSAGVQAIGYMVKPKGEKGPFPAVLTVHGAGTFFSRLDEAIQWGQRGAISWTMNPHPLANDAPKAQRMAIANGALKYYNQFGKNTRREDVYFNGMFQRNYQVIQAIKNSPLWDKKHLVVRGFSQGGAQSLATAFLCPEVTAIAPRCPALCDIAANLEGRAPCWPYWVADKNLTRDSKEFESTRTFDLVNLAPHMKTKMLLGAGLFDPTCPAPGQMALYNGYAGPKRIIYMFDTPHGQDQNWIAQEKAFVAEALGLPAPQ